jgi:hypothetical protein
MNFPETGNVNADGDAHRKKPEPLLTKRNETLHLALAR